MLLQTHPSQLNMCLHVKKTSQVTNQDIACSSCNVMSNKPTDTHRETYVACIGHMACKLYHMYHIKLYCTLDDMPCIEFSGKAYICQNKNLAYSVSDEHPKHRKCYSWLLMLTRPWQHKACQLATMTAKRCA